MEHLCAIADGGVVPEAGEREVVFCMDEFEPLDLMPHPGRQWAEPGGKHRGPDREPRRRRATYNRYGGVRHLFAALDLTRDRLYGHVKPVVEIAFPRPSASAKSSAPSTPDQPPLIEDALGKQMLALLIQLDAACTAADQFAGAVAGGGPVTPRPESRSMPAIQEPLTGARASQPVPPSAAMASTTCLS